ncbi:ankyrin repeat domain-containing protein [Gemmata sp.]|uniref:ankyrin repeat domain-containing protein n=1 Tax=Gemmata sp. TaxID=1914242 RepID=UPI003F70EC77
MSALAVALFLVNSTCPTETQSWRLSIHAGVREGNALRVHLILVCRPDLLNAVETRTKLPLTPLQIAADRGKTAVVKVLLAHGADVHADGWGWTSPLQLAASRGHREIAELLLKHGAVLDLYSAVALGRREEVEGYLQLAEVFGLSKQLANVCWAESPWHDTPLLRVAIGKGHVEMVRLLLAHGASPFTRPVTRPCYISDNNWKGATIGLAPAGTAASDFDLPALKP